MEGEKQLRRVRVGSAGASVLVALLLVGFAGAGAAQGRASATLAVCGSGAAFTTIQAAIDAAAAGDRIEVCPGTFTGQLVIATSVTLAGAGAGQSVIAAPSPLTGDQDIVVVRGAGTDVDLGDFTISGPGNPAGDCTGLLSGVFVRDGAHATIHDNTISDIRDNPIDGCQKGSGVRVGRTALATSGSATITRNRITAFQKTGVVVDYTGSKATVTDNTITGVGPTGQLAQNGIQISRGADATVSGNRVSAVSYSPSAQATGILLYGMLGTVSVSDNTVVDNDLGINAASVSSGNLTISSNKVEGAKYGILLSSSSGVLVEKNTVSGADITGVGAEKDAAGNTFRGNVAAGASGEDHFDCRDDSVGDKTATTANTWTANIGPTASPADICAPKQEPAPEPPVEIDPPAVIVLPPSGGGETPTPQPPAPELPAPQPPSPDPTPQPPQPSPPAQPNPPVQQVAANEIVASMKEHDLKSCLITVTSRGKPATEIARGLARVPKGRRPVLIVRLGVLPKGQELLSKQFGGAIVDVRAVCRTAAGTTGRGVKAARAVLLVEHTVTTPGSWVPDQPVLTATGREFIDGLKRRTARLQGIRCDGYTATWIPSPADPETLSLARAKLACAELHRKGLDVRARLVAHGRDDPIASNDTEAGRAANRRVAITFVHQLVHRPIR